MITTTLNRIRAHSPCRKTGCPQFIGRLVGGALPDGRYVFVVGPPADA